MFEKIKQTKKENKKLFVGAAIVGGVVLLGVAYRQGMIKGIARGAYLGGYQIGSIVRKACENGSLPPDTHVKILELVKNTAEGNI